MKFDVVTFGSAVIDVFVDTGLNETGKLMCYDIGSKISVKDLRFGIGGGGTNTSVAFSRLGLKTGCITKVGKDNPGKDVLDLLKKEKVKFLGKTGNNATGHSIVLDSNQRNRTILTYKGINNEISSNDIKKFKTKWLYYSSLLETSFKTQKELALKLSKKGVKLAFNPSEYLIKKENLSSLLKITNVLILNKEEAELLTKEKDLLIGLSKLGPKIVVITNEDKKISCYDGKKKYYLMPHKLKVVEKTGAGDAFASAFVAALIRNKPIPYCLKIGLKNSESVVTHFGVKSSLIKKWL